MQIGVMSHSMSECLVERYGINMFLGVVVFATIKGGLLKCFCMSAGEFGQMSPTPTAFECPFYLGSGAAVGRGRG